MSEQVTRRDTLRRIALALTAAGGGSLTAEAAQHVHSTAATEKANGIDNVEKKAAAFRDNVFTAQLALRQDIDALEQILPRTYWPVPTYADMLFNF